MKIAGQGPMHFPLQIERRLEKLQAGCGTRAWVAGGMVRARLGRKLHGRQLEMVPCTMLVSAQCLSFQGPAGLRASGLGSLPSCQDGFQ